jgi:hypothetical protein
MLGKLLLDVLPYDPDEERRIREVYNRVATDTIDTIQGVVQQVGDSATGGGHHSLPYILGAIAAALVALGLFIFMVRSYRRRGEQQLGFTR